MLREVRLYGHLGAAFGRVHRFDVQSVAEALKALAANFPAFRPHLAAHNAPGYKVWVRTEGQTLEHLGDPSGGVIRIAPVVHGAGNGVGQVILGAALIAFSVFNPGFGAFAIGAINTSVSAIAFNVGVSMLIGGVAQMLFAPPTRQQTSQEKPENRPSYAYDGVVNTVLQGGPVPVCYGGPIRVGSQVISAGLSVEQIT